MAGAGPVPLMLACLPVFMPPAILHMSCLGMLQLEVPDSLCVGILAVHPSFQALKVCLKVACSVCSAVFAANNTAVSEHSQSGSEVPTCCCHLYRRTGES